MGRELSTEKRKWRHKQYDSLFPQCSNTKAQSDFLESFPMLLFTIKRVLGLVILALGLVSLFLPVLPGAIFVFIGMELLGLSFLIPAPIRNKWDDLKGRMKMKWDNRKKEDQR